MRLKTQFAVLTVAVTLLPILFGVLFFGFQQAPRDPRAPTREFIAALLGRVNAGESLTIDIMKAEAENVGMPLREVALLKPDRNGAPLPLIGA